MVLSPSPSRFFFQLYWQRQNVKKRIQWFIKCTSKTSILFLPLHFLEIGNFTAWTMVREARRLTNKSFSCDSSAKTLLKRIDRNLRAPGSIRSHDTKDSNACNSCSFPKTWKVQENIQINWGGPTKMLTCAVRWKNSCWTLCHAGCWDAGIASSWHN